MHPGSPLAIKSLEACLPTVTPTAARAARLLHDARLAPWWRELGAAAPPMACRAAPTGPQYRLRIASDAGPVELRLASRHLAGLAVAGAADLSEPLRALAAEALIGPLLQTLAAWGLGATRPVALHAVEPTSAPDAAGVWSVVRGAQGTELWLAFETLPRPLAERVGELARRTPTRCETLRRRLAMPAAAVLGERPASVALLRSLSPGDVLLLPEPGAGLPGAPCWLRWRTGTAQQLYASARLDTDSLTIEGEPNMADEPHAPYTDAIEDEAGQPAAMSGPLDQLDIPVRFEVDTVPVPLAELEALRPGYVVELAASVTAAPLRLTAYGQLIAHAEMVAVGDRLGARITRMVVQDEPDSTAH
ncbi:type III secretion system cytoplasmic ring protein SctQ [Caldimonas brevitalea]|uniref:Type III secretion inner membrane protein n=1 Tax=Caldimonas brevitalea TaxID=413882 RepID=A0A0G3BMS2_9BURK|nr:type III secretion system cytoplasmic ring protein SctQ [Caldimonas brevitalea]AKJ27815.1 type III secretion inner membrane protein [Caldimonas brevitalea]